MEFPTATGGATPSPPTGSFYHRTTQKMSWSSAANKRAAVYGYAIEDCYSEKGGYYLDGMLARKCVQNGWNPRAVFFQAYPWDPQCSDNQHQSHMRDEADFMRMVEREKNPKRDKKNEIARSGKLPHPGAWCGLRMNCSLLAPSPRHAVTVASTPSYPVSPCC